MSCWGLLTVSLALHSEVAVGQEQAFSVNTRGAGGQGQLDVRMTSPSRRPIPCKLEPGGGAEAQAVRYMPPEEGPYKVDITYDGHPVPGSPFAVEGVLPPDPSKVSIRGLDDRKDGCILVRDQKDRCAWSRHIQGQERPLYKACLRDSLVVQSWLWNLTELESHCYFISVSVSSPGAVTTLR